MMKFLLGGAASLALVAIAPAVAQPTPPPAPVAPAPQTHVVRMPMKIQTRDEVMIHAREMFAKLDTNKDGFVTREEADAAHKAMAGGIRERLATRRADGSFARDRGAMFDRLDSNKDGSISRQEFMAAQPQGRERRVIVMRDGERPVEGAGKPGEPHLKMMRMHRGMGMRMHGKMFETADANRDGRVSLQEMTNAALQHFDAADANRDGKLTPEERMQMRKQRRAQQTQPA